jgi:hypothetical protein
MSLILSGFTANTTTSPRTIWGDSSTATVVPPATAATVSIASTSTDDDGNPTTNTGAHTILIKGLNSSYQEIQEIVTLNGTTTVTSTNLFLRINSLEVLTTGSGGTNAGNIWVGTGLNTAGKFATNYATITATLGRSLDGYYTVPAGKNLHITNISCSASLSAANDSVFFILQQRINSPARPYQTLLNVVNFGTVVTDLVIPGGSDLQVIAQALNAGHSAGVQISGYLQ